MVLLGSMEIIRHDDENSVRGNTRATCHLQRNFGLKGDSTDDRDRTGDGLFTELEVQTHSLRRRRGGRTMTSREHLSLHRGYWCRGKEEKDSVDRSDALIVLAFKS